MGLRRRLSKKWNETVNGVLSGPGVDVDSVNTEVGNIKDTDIGGSGQQDNIGVFGDALRVGLLPDPHYNEIDVKGWGSSGDSRSSVNTFIDTMNNEYDPHFVAVLGDLTHGLNPSNGDGLPTETEKVNWGNALVDLLESSGGSDNSGLNCPVFYTPGDHDYAGAGRWNMSNVLSPFGIGNLSDRYYSFDAGGWHIVVLDTSYSTYDIFPSGSSSNSNETWIADSSDPFNALEWLRKDVRDVDKPVAVLGHHPLDIGSGMGTKEYTGNQYEASETLARKTNVTYVHGHSHHTFGRSNSRIGPRGVRNVFINEVDDDNAGVLNLFDTSYTVHSIRSNGTAFQEYSGLSQPLNWDSYPEDYQQIAQRVQEERMRHDSAQGRATPIKSGSATTEVIAQGFRMATGATQDSEAGYFGDGVSVLDDNFSGGTGFWRGRRAFFDIKVNRTGADMEAEIVQGPSSYSDTSPHIGFKVRSNDLYATVSDGNAETNEQILSGIDDNGNFASRLGFSHEAFGPFGDQVVFYMNGKRQATISSNLPTGNVSKNPFYYAVRNPSSTNNYVLVASQCWYRQPNVHQPYTV